MKQLAILIAALLAGCASYPTPQDSATADYGSYPSNYEYISKTYFENLLKDPFSAQYRGITAPKKFWLGDRINGTRYGYLTCVTVNAKNSYGAYTGFTTEGLLIRNGVVVQYLQKGIWYGRKMC